MRPKFKVGDRAVVIGDTRYAAFGGAYKHKVPRGGEVTIDAVYEDEYQGNDGRFIHVYHVTYHSPDGDICDRELIERDLEAAIKPATKREVDAAIASILTSVRKE